MAEEFKTELELMKKDIGMISKLVEKFDVTIEKLQQVATDISRIVAIQDQKIQVQERINAEVDKALERQARDHADEIKELTALFNAHQNAIMKELQATKSDLNEKINSLEKWRYAAMAVISVLAAIATNAVKIFF